MVTFPTSPKTMKTKGFEEKKEGAPAKRLCRDPRELSFRPQNIRFFLELCRSCSFLMRQIDIRKQL